MLLCALVKKKPIADLKQVFRKTFSGIGNSQLAFTYPEVAVNNRHCRELFLSKYYQRNVVIVVVDEAYFSIEW